ncbi:MAG: hypothetical protein JW893_06980 [Candidatus Omnitrophica bacterium]|nr:hypothetical protein [Candidatus Omnitrophota bacterium]
MEEKKQNREEPAWRLGEILVRNGHITWEQLEEALSIQKKTGKMLGEILRGKGFVTSRDLYQALAIQYRRIFVDFTHINVQKDVLRLIPKGFVYEHKIMPLVLKDRMLLVAISNPLNVWPEEQIKRYLGPGYEVRPVLACPEDIEEALFRHYGPPTAIQRPEA